MFEPGNQDIIDQVIGGLVRRWGSVNRRLVTHIFALLENGRAVPVEQVACAASTNQDTVESAVRSAYVSTDEEHRVTSLFGLGVDPQAYRIEFEDNVLYACCGLVAHAAGDLLGRPVVIKCLDPLTWESVEIDVRGDTLASVTPSPTVATLVKVYADTFGPNIGENFCTNIRHFAGPESAEQFCAQDRKRVTIPLEEFHATAHELYMRLWHFDSP